MIIGRGLLAKAFAPSFELDDNILIFASGVSNSAETRQEEFDREHTLLQSFLTGGRRLVYFSSCAVANPYQARTPYFLHKSEMENHVLHNGGLVLRLPQVVGNSRNHNTLTNFLFDRLTNDTAFNLWAHVERNLIDVDHVVRIATTLIRSNFAPDRIPVSIASPRSISMLDLVNVFEYILQKKGNYNILDKKIPFPIESTLCQQIAANIGISFDEQYLERLLRKYYGSLARAY